MSSRIKIAFISVRESYIEHETCFYDVPNGRLIEALKKSHPDITLVTYTTGHKKIQYTLQIRPKRLLFFSFTNTFGNGIRYMWQAIQMFHSLQKDHDLLIVQLPFKSFLAPLFIYKSVIYHLCINIKTAAANPVKYKGLKLLAAKSYAQLLHIFQKFYLLNPNAQLIANGNELAAMFNPQKSRATISASLYNAEILPKSEIENKQFNGKLLFVGRPSKVKGFDILLKVFSELQCRFPYLTLTCIGFSKEEFENTLELPKLKKSIWETIDFKGSIPFSQALFDQYIAHDILILPSRSEGTPRVLVEARAFGCLVVASRVDGIPSSVTHEFDGLLFPPEDVTELQNQLSLLITSPELQKKLRLNGWETAKKNTVDAFVSVFEDTIQELRQRSNH